jgi:hypothetical protein
MKTDAGGVAVMRNRATSGYIHRARQGTNAGKRTSRAREGSHSRGTAEGDGEFRDGNSFPTAQIWESEAGG